MTTINMMSDKTKVARRIANDLAIVISEAEKHGTLSRLKSVAIYFDEAELRAIVEYLAAPSETASGAVAFKPITMSDVRLIAGEGKLTPHDVLAAVNGHLRLHAGALRLPVTSTQQVSK